MLGEVAHAGWLDKARLLVEAGLNPCVGHVGGLPALHMACTGNKADLVQYFLSLPMVRDLNPMALRDRLRRTLLSVWASGGGSLDEATHREVIKVFMEMGADVNFSMERGVSPLICAVAAGQTPVVQVAWGWPGGA